MTDPKTSNGCQAASRKASREDLHQLYRALVDRLLEYLTTQPAEKLRASMLEVIRGTLKDAGVFQDVRDAGAARRALEELKEAGEDLDAFVIPFPPKLEQ